MSPFFFASIASRGRHNSRAERSPDTRSPALAGLFYDPDLTAGGEVAAGELLLAAGVTVSGALLPS